MSKQVVIHAVVEMLIISSITVYLNRRIKSSEDVIRGLKSQVDNLQNTVNAMSKHLDNIYGILETLPIPPVGFRPQMRQKMMPPMAQQQQQPQQQQQQQLQQQQQQPQVDQQMMGSPPMDMGMGMIGGLLSAMMGSGQGPATVLMTSTAAPAQKSAPVQITEEDDDDPAVKEALDQLLNEVKEETQGLKAEESTQAADA
jgi:hypothetical protein